jgi:hypothetical protein
LGVIYEEESDIFNKLFTRKGGGRRGDLGSHTEISLGITNNGTGNASTGIPIYQTSFITPQTTIIGVGMNNQPTAQNIAFRTTELNQMVFHFHYTMALMIGL